VQVDGVGGAHPLASKVAVVSPSHGDDADIDYLFLRLGSSKAIASHRSIRCRDRSFADAFDGPVIVLLVKRVI